MAQAITARPQKAAAVTPAPKPESINRDEADEPTTGTTQGRTAYPGQLSLTELKTELQSRREAAELRRANWLATHEGWVACAVPSCSGLVSPEYRRTNADGREVGMCPRRSAHRALAPSIFRSR